MEEQVTKKEDQRREQYV